MNVFVLGTGRCGTYAFTQACRHITNYTVGHGSHVSVVGPARLNYPPNHIEADDRLSWFLGRLDERFGTGAFYVHLLRAQQQVARSFHRRWQAETGIMRHYARGILQHAGERFEICLDYWETVTANIRLFLKDKPQAMEIRLEHAPERFPEFWGRIGAEGDLRAAVAEWDVTHDRFPA
jgi:hypothetical protein